MLPQTLEPIEDDLVYVPSKGATSFLRSNAFVIAIMGPIGSGKSVACCIKLLMLAKAQQPDKNNVRRTRWAIIRNTYRELLDTTMATFFTWVDKECGTYSVQNLTFVLEQSLPDGTIMYAEFLFRALDKPDDIKKLLSLEITGAWINEAREISKAVVDMAQGRVGRYPSRFLHAPPTWFGIIMDTNPPDTDHWWYKTFEEEMPDNHFIVKQPGGNHPDAENLQNLPPDYYKNMSASKTQDWTKVYIDGQYGFVADGKPVYPEYNDSLHYIPYVKPHLNQPQTKIYVGIDFGLTPAALIAVETSTGQLIAIDELVCFNMGAVSFGSLLHTKLTKHPYDKCTIEIYGDPAGEQRAQTDENTPFLILQEQGILAYPTYTNDPRIRREVVASLLTTLDFTGQPALIITAGAPTFHKGMMGGYKYKRVLASGAERYMEKPDKNMYSHICDAGQYLCLGAKGDANVIGGNTTKAIDYSKQQRYYR